MDNNFRCLVEMIHPGDMKQEFLSAYPHFLLSNTKIHFNVHYLFGIDFLQNKNLSSHRRTHHHNLRHLLLHNFCSHNHLLWKKKHNTDWFLGRCKVLTNQNINFLALL